MLQNTPKLRLKKRINKAELMIVLHNQGTKTLCNFPLHQGVTNNLIVLQIIELT